MSGFASALVSVIFFALSGFAFGVFADLVTGQAKLPGFTGWGVLVFLGTAFFGCGVLCACRRDP